MSHHPVFKCFLLITAYTSSLDWWQVMQSCTVMYPKFKTKRVKRNARSLYSLKTQRVKKDAKKDFMVNPKKILFSFLAFLS